MCPIPKCSHLLLVFVLLLLSSQNAKSQCPLDISETIIAPTQDLTLYFPFDGNVDNMGDSTYSATLSGPNFVNTECGQGLEYDGVDDYVKVEPIVWLLEDYTFTAFVKHNAGGNGLIFGIRDQCTSTYRGWSLVSFQPISGRLYNGLNKNVTCTNWSNGMRYRSAPGVFPDDTRVFVAISVVNNNDNSRVIRFYVKCADYSAELYQNYGDGYGAPMSSIFDPARAYETMIGANSTVPGRINGFDGIIDEVRVYETALSPEQIDSVYRSCLPITTSMERFSNCETDSAEIKLAHSELDVNYQLFDVTNSVYINPVISGNCDTLIFNTPLVSDTTQYRIVAIHNVSNCTLNMDSIFTIHPESHTFYGNLEVAICYGDSIQVNDSYVHTPGIYFDTVELTPFCDSIITTTLTELPNLIIDFSVVDTITCGTSNAQFTDQSAMSSTVVSSVWDFGDGSISSLPNPTHAFATSGSYLVALTKTTASGCTYTKSRWVEIIIYPQPYADFTFASMQPSVGEPVQFIDESINANDWLWDFGDTSGSGNQNPLHSFNPLGIYSVVLFVSNGICHDSASVRIDVEDEIIFYIPNAFTPDGDEMNNSFLPVFDSGFDPYDYHLTIFDRWGEVIFESYNASYGWDGSYGDNSMAQDGVYVWEVEFGIVDNDKRHHHTGQLTLLR